MVALSVGLNGDLRRTPSVASQWDCPQHSPSANGVTVGTVRLTMACWLGQISRCRHPIGTKHVPFRSAEGRGSQDIDIRLEISALYFARLLDDDLELLEVFWEKPCLELVSGAEPIRVVVDDLVLEKSNHRWVISFGSKSTFEGGGGLSGSAQSRSHRGLLGTVARVARSGPAADSPPSRVLGRRFRVGLRCRLCQYRQELERSHRIGLNRGQA